MPRQAQFAAHLDGVAARGDALELDSFSQFRPFGAVEAGEEIEIPPRAPEFSVGDGFEPDLFLFADRALDFGVFDLLEIVGADFAFRASGACLLQAGRSEQAAD